MAVRRYYSQSWHKTHIQAEYISVFFTESYMYQCVTNTTWNSSVLLTKWNVSYKVVKTVTAQYRKKWNTGNTSLRFLLSTVIVISIAWLLSSKAVFAKSTISICSLSLFLIHLSNLDILYPSVVSQTPLLFFYAVFDFT